MSSSSGSRSMAAILAKERVKDVSKRSREEDLTVASVVLVVSVTRGKKSGPCSTELARMTDRA